MSAQDTSTDRFRRPATWLMALAAGILLLQLVLRFSGVAIWDDAYIYTRYSDQFLANGVPAFNPDEPATYGITSPAFGGLVTAVRAVTPQASPAVPLWLTSLVCGLAMLPLLILLLLRYGDAYHRHRWQVLGMLAIAVGFNAPQIATHLASGMDTSLAISYLALYLLLWKSFESHLSPGKALVLGLLGGLAYFIRPELLVFTLGMPASLLVFSGDRIIRQEAAYTLIFTAFSILTQLWIAMNFFGTMVPLSFYVKTLSPYGPELLDTYRFEGLGQWGLFLVSNWLPVGLSIAAVAVSFRNWRKSFTLLDKTVAVCLLLFWAYQVGLVTPIMGYQQRFYYPAWPALVYLGARSLVLLMYERPAWNQQLEAWLHGKWVWLPTAVLVAGFLGLAVLRRPANLRSSWGHFDMATIYAHLGQNNWPYLDRVSILPKDLSIASTEIGILSAMNPGRRIVDLAGLTDPETARQGLSLKRLMAQPPDLVYLPHPDYVQMQKALLEDPWFQAEYQIWRAKELQSWQGMAIRRNSRYFHQIRFMIEGDAGKTSSQ